MSGLQNRYMYNIGYSPTGIQRSDRAQLRNEVERRRVKSEERERAKKRRNDETRYARNRKRWRFLLFRLLTIHDIRQELRSRMNRRHENTDRERYEPEVKLPTL